MWRKIWKRSILTLYAVQILTNISILAIFRSSTLIDFKVHQITIFRNETPNFKPNLIFHELFEADSSNVFKLWLIVSNSNIHKLQIVERGGGVSAIFDNFEIFVVVFCCFFPLKTLVFYQILHNSYMKDNLQQKIVKKYRIFDFLEIFFCFFQFLPL